MRNEGDRAAPGRRGLLVGLGLAGGAAALVGPAAAARHGGATAPSGRSFHGAHQAGIVTPQPPAGMVASFDVLAETTDDLARLFRALTARIAFLTQGGATPALDPRLPPADSGLLGPRIVPDGLTITVAVGASLFEDSRYGLAAQRPLHLAPMRQFPNDALEPELCHGDLLLQICSNAAESNIHALRDVVKHLPDLLALRWKLDGFLPARRPADETPRNLLGFKDGTANLDSRDGALMDRLVWTRAGAGEPAWTEGGSYQVVRIVRLLVERWDRTPLREQEQIFGRDKATGSPLGQRRERDDPGYAADPHGLRIPLDAHIRRANPRTAETQGNRILRRGYNYDRGVTRAGQLDMGLLFICYQADLKAGFLTVQRRLDGESLEEYVKPIGGGYFFALPGLTAAGSFLGAELFPA